MDFTDVAQGICDLDDAVAAHPRIPGLYLLTAPVRLSSQAVTTEQMRALLRQVRSRFDYCLLDAPAGLGTGFQLATCAADQCVVVTCTDASSLRDAQHTVMELGRFPTDQAGLPLLGVVPEDDTLPLCLNRGQPPLPGESRLAAAAYRNIAKRIQGERVPLLRIR